MSKEKEIILLAAEEGHDADIPSNEGVVNTNLRSAVTESNTLNEKDIEKTAGSLTSTTASVHSLKGNGERPNNDISSDIVDWDGADDPQNPMNWTNGRKWFAVGVVSVITFLYVVFGFCKLGTDLV